MAFIWFFKIRGHFCKKLVWCNTYVDSKAKFIPDAFAYLVCCIERGTKQVDGICHIQKGFVNTEFLMVRSIFL